MNMEAKRAVWFLTLSYWYLSLELCIRRLNDGIIKFFPLAGSNPFLRDVPPRAPPQLPERQFHSIGIITRVVSRILTKVLRLRGVQPPRKTIAFLPQAMQDRRDIKTNRSNNVG